MTPHSLLLRAWPTCTNLFQIPSNPSPLLTIFDFDPEEVARQMTIIDFSLFAKIKPAELLNQVRIYVYMCRCGMSRCEIAKLNSGS